MKAFNIFNTPSPANAAVPAVTVQSSFGELWQPNSGAAQCEIGLLSGEAARAPPGRLQQCLTPIPNRVT